MLLRKLYSRCLASLTAGRARAAQLLSLHRCLRLSSTRRVPDGEPLFNFPEAPLPYMCCGSGCQNCVWIQYGEDIVRYMHRTQMLHSAPDDPQKRRAFMWEHLEKNVEDVSLRAYLWTELQAKKVL